MLLVTVVCYYVVSLLSLICYLYHELQIKMSMLKPMILWAVFVVKCSRLTGKSVVLPVRCGTELSLKTLQKILKSKFLFNLLFVCLLMSNLNGSTTSDVKQRTTWITLNYFQQRSWYRIIQISYDASAGGRGLNQSVIWH